MRRAYLICLWVMVMLASPVWAGPPVLVIHSYDPGYSWTQRIQMAIADGLGDAGISFEVFYMDTKRRPKKNQIEQAAATAAARVAAIKPKVIIAVDDNAQQYLASGYAGAHDVQIVFCGVNAEASAYHYPAPNVTGLLERTYARQALRMLKVLIPSTMTAACLTDDSPTSDLEVRRIKKQAQNGRLPAVVVDYHQPRTWSQWTAAVERMNADSRVDAILLFLFHTVKTNDERQTINPVEVATWTTRNTTKPVVGLWASAAEYGALCSVVVDPWEHGHTAAKMTQSILKGQRAGDIPLRINQNGQAILNLTSPAARLIDPTVDGRMVADRVIQ